ncbi:1,2-phenylacetyl-CoA epoxidase subunit PaaB [Streptomyces sp. CB01881]|uniref:1,2-phenylacetyl-CoA epoxidase subunit PaaB n=1 Tax=Streptomyces sp. CB01881 TaxID=2078691 RepID=UPI000CDC50E0|nr:1,2-phenylacetyl-CoA epoxidase subunit PaaB [Streptomyces sp. CB01881]AUY48470.1 1,2-phenylacetyl-CoA epoxidase subunit B [Streptomyces sp. CB01881]TYC76959.1 1,2-phenylacetyl-CoA epoxidase subunit B [Streptomyces sp. CB01881]
MTSGNGSPSASWEVFLRASRGLAHQHVGSVRAADRQLALATARDLFARRGEPQSLWVVRSDQVHAVSPQEKDPYFAGAADKPYRYPGHYTPLGGPESSATPEPPESTEGASHDR